MYLAIFMLILGAFFLVIFLFAMKNGQFEDLKTPAHKMLLDNTIEETPLPKDEVKISDKQ